MGGSSPSVHINYAAQDLATLGGERERGETNNEQHSERREMADSLSLPLSVSKCGRAVLLVSIQQTRTCITHAAFRTESFARTLLA